MTLAHLLPLLLRWGTSVEGVLWSHSGANVLAHDSALESASANLINVCFVQGSSTHQNSTCHHIGLHSSLHEIICDISIETSTRNQTAFVFQSLVCNTALLLWATEGENLQDEISFKDLAVT